MTSKVFRHTLRYMGLAFIRPQAVLDGLGRESSLRYGILAMVLAWPLWCLLDLLAYLQHTQAGNPFPKIIPLPDRTYPLYQGSFRPVVDVVDFLVFGGILAALARLFRLQQVAVRQVVAFYMFIWNTVGLLAVLAHLVAAVLRWPLKWVAPVHQVCALIDLAYLTEFLHRQARISRGQAPSPS